MYTIQDAIESICEDICTHTHTDPDGNRKRAEAVTLLAMASNFMPSGEVTEDDSTGEGDRGQAGPDGQA